MKVGTKEDITLSTGLGRVLCDGDSGYVDDTSDTTSISLNTRQAEEAPRWVTVPNDGWRDGIM